MIMSWHERKTWRAGAASVENLNVIASDLQSPYADHCTKCTGSQLNSGWCVYILCPMPTAQCTQPIAQLYPQPQPSTSAHNLVQRHTLHYHWRYVLYARVSYKLYLCATSIVIYSFSYVYSGLIQTLGQQHSPFFFSRIQAVLSNFLNFFLNKPNHEKFTIVKV